MTVTAAVIRKLVEAGLTSEQLLIAVEAIEQAGGGATRRLYERAPTPANRVYGPAVEPSSYVSDEKRRAYAWALRFVDSPGYDPTPIDRLAEKDWLELSGFVLRRDGFVCTYCGNQGDGVKLHCDHIVPVSRGGPNSEENLTTACEFCNCSKHNRLPFEWADLKGSMG